MAKAVGLIESLYLFRDAARDQAFVDLGRVGVLERATLLAAPPSPRCWGSAWPF